MVLVDEVRAALERGEAAECVDPRMGGFAEEEAVPVLKLGLVIKAPVVERMAVLRQ
ncbi:hypothetical protein HPP92_024659 [Vanilla planifolia]|uniref:Uncharacterized protein n=1 Tax=Vanilla planifolia TaxID=51239 RepID=A0A835PSI8_VANPL|nr:hypothetical protein HPP92_024659 [Vanilla planifolia]